MLSWERLGIADEVDQRLLCPDIHVDDTSFFCGFIKNMHVDDPQSNSHFYANDVVLNHNSIADTFCVNVSDCFISLPYLCEVNCTGQEEKCSTWKRGLIYLIVVLIPKKKTVIYY